MKNIQDRIADIRQRLNSVSGINVIEVNYYDNESSEQAVERYKKNNNYKETSNPDIFVYIKSDEQIRAERASKKS